MMDNKTIQLHGGPCNKQVVEDRGQVNVMMSIASPFDNYNNKPMPFAFVGTAIYEVEDESGNAYWLMNKWHGQLVD